MAQLPLLVKHSGYNQNFKSLVVAAPSNKQVQLYAARAVNSSGGAIAVGLVKKLAPIGSGPSIYLLTAASTPDATDISSAIAAGTSTTIVSTTNNDGFMLQSSKPFNLVGITCSQASTGSPVYAYKYWDGSAFQTLTTLAAPDFSTTGDKQLAFHAPIDWVAGTDAATGGLDGMYTIKVIATTAPTQAVKATAAWLGGFLAYNASVANNGELVFPASGVLPESSAIIFDVSEGLAAYFATASAANSVSGIYSIQG